MSCLYKIQDIINTIICGEALEILGFMPDECINMVITSPPYWSFRDYGIDEQLGLESTFEEYISRLCDIFDGIYRVLKKEGTCWVNMGDTYAGNCNFAESKGKWNDKAISGKWKESLEEIKKAKANINWNKNKLKSKSLCLIPFRFAIEMCNRGWILRNTIIWHKPSAMPSSAKDRFTVDFEYLFFFTKNKKYYFEQQFESLNPDSLRDNKRNKKNPKGADRQDLDKWTINPLGRNKRTVWSIATQPYPEAHFSVYPPNLLETPIKAGCPEFICSKCGKPRIKIFDRQITDLGKVYNDKTADEIGASETSILRRKAKVSNIIFQGYTDCGCNEPFIPGIVLDPFLGSGTTAEVALKLGRRFIGIELNPKYIEMANRRIESIVHQRKLFEEM